MTEAGRAALRLVLRHVEDELARTLRPGQTISATVEVDIKDGIPRPRYRLALAGSRDASPHAAGDGMLDEAGALAVR